MEKNKKGSVVKALMVGSALISLSAAGAQQAHAATGTGAMTAIILTPIAVTAPTDLHFGSITVTAAAGTVVIDTAGGRTVTGGVSEVVGTGSESEAVISVSAGTGINIVLSMAAASFTVTNGLLDTMAVDTFNIRTAAGGATQTVTLTASPGTFPIGGTLNVGAGQATGTYTGNFTVNANYQ